MTTILFETWPFLFMALMFLIFGLVTKHNYKQKHKNCVKAKVIDVVRHPKYDKNGFLSNETYTINIEYMEHGNVKHYQCNHMFAYDVGDVIDILIFNDKCQILTQSNNCFYSQSIAHPTWYKVLFVISAIFTTISIVSICTHISFVEKYLSILITGLSIIGLQYIIYKNNKKNSSFNKHVLQTNIDATVVDIRKYRRNSNDHYYTEYYYNVAYEFKDKTFYYNLPVKCNNDLNMIGKSIQINIDAKTGKYINRASRNNWLPLARFVQVFFIVLFIVSVVQMFC